MNMRRICTCGSWSLLTFLNVSAEDQTDTHKPQPAQAEQPNQLPQGVPPLLCEAIVKVSDADQPDAAWTLSLISLREKQTFLEFQQNGQPITGLVCEGILPAFERTTGDLAYAEFHFSNGFGRQRYVYHPGYTLPADLSYERWHTRIDDNWYHRRDDGN